MDEIVDMPMMRNYIVLSPIPATRTPRASAPSHQMLLPRTIRDFETYKK